MNLYLLLLCFFAIGIVGGFQFGLMGIGTGLIALPIMFYLIPKMGIPVYLVSSVSIATVSATLAVTSISTVITHMRYRKIQWPLVFQLAPVAIVGIVAGVYLNANLPSDLSRKVLSILIMLIAVKMLLESRKSESLDQQVSFPKYIQGLAFGLGMFTGMVGIANLVLLPFYNHYLGMKKALGTAMASSLIFLCFTTAVYIALGVYQGVSTHRVYLVGYLDWPATLLMAVGAVMSAPLGVRLSHKVPVSKLKMAVAIMIFVVAIKLFLSS
ncbi:sulfite exporter TauE/SafE family protein [Vibrio sp. S4M6]|uniref:sulfite exporter TauE/SafE family protein n=1 Tax=Vibrio sinus TaxID=2946865 RepID=UPI002029CA62|nr:sulfite exporter TauE/SafE family protein [Vibrio sinus]MCL9782756.1 sulfite exporter TauE/SafE family protein [Vibrio sinus]